jgi:hypothetical protein
LGEHRGWTNKRRTRSKRLRKEQQAAQDLSGQTIFEQGVYGDFNAVNPNNEPTYQEQKERRCIVM